MSIPSAPVQPGALRESQIVAVTVPRRRHRTIQAIAAGTLTGISAISVHGLVGGHWPDAAEWVLLVLMCIGCAFAAGGATSRRALLTAATLGQLWTHAVLSLSLHDQSHSVLCHPRMLIFHAAAVPICVATLLALQCALTRAGGATLTAVRRLIAHPTPQKQLCGVAAAGPERLPSALICLVDSVVRRGPPAAAI